MESDWRSFFYKFSDKMEMASGPDGILKALKEIDVEKEIKKRVKEFPNIKSADAKKKSMSLIKLLINLYVSGVSFAFIGLVSIHKDVSFHVALTNFSLGLRLIVMFPPIFRATGLQPASIIHTTAITI